MSDDPESTIPWPGFVDILSTVIIVFVFFMMMTSTIIFLMAQKQQEKAVSDAKQEVIEDINNVDIKQVLLENSQLKKQVEDMVRVKSILGESESQIVSKQENGVKITFNDFGVTLLPETTESIKSYLSNVRKVQLQAYVPQNYAATREIALNRALNVRNLLIQAGLKPENVELKILTDTTGNEGAYGHILLSY